MFDDRTPIYRQIADRLRAEILAGTLLPGDQVLSTTQYSAHHRINPATVAKGFQELVDEGLLHKRRGIGMFVSDGAPERLRAERRARFVDEVLTPVLVEAGHLGLTVDELVDAIRTHHAAPGGAAP